MMVKYYRVADWDEMDSWDQYFEYKGGGTFIVNTMAIREIHALCNSTKHTCHSRQASASIKTHLVRKDSITVRWLQTVFHAIAITCRQSEKD